MRKKLTRTGNSLALVLDRALLERARIGEDTPLDVTTDGHVVVISSVRNRRRTAKLTTMEEAHRRYGGTFKRLAECRRGFTLGDVLSLRCGRNGEQGGTRRLLRGARTTISLAIEAQRAEAGQEPLDEPAQLAEPVGRS